jgi:hypothetical protein
MDVIAAPVAQEVGDYLQVLRKQLLADNEDMSDILFNRPVQSTSRHSQVAVFVLPPKLACYA